MIEGMFSHVSQYIHLTLSNGYVSQFKSNSFIDGYLVFSSTFHYHTQNVVMTILVNSYFYNTSISLGWIS